MPPPKYVRFDVQPLFISPERSDVARIGVVTALAHDSEDGSLRVRGGVGDGGLHDELAAQVGPVTDKTVPLPPEMYSRLGTIRAWYTPQAADQAGLIAGQIEDAYSPEARLTRQETDLRLRLAGLALFVLLQRAPLDLLCLRAERPGGIILHRTVLERAGRRLGRAIYGS